MATITEKSPAMSDVAERSGVCISFTIIDHDDARAVEQATANSREKPNLRDRIFVETTLIAQRSDGRFTSRETTPQHVDSTNYAGLNLAALLAALKIIHDVDQAREDLAQ